MKKMTNKTVLKLGLVEQDKNGKEVSHFCCDRKVAFTKFDGKEATNFMEAIQLIAQTLGGAMGFRIY